MKRHERGTSVRHVLQRDSHSGYSRNGHEIERPTHQGQSVGAAASSRASYGAKVGRGGGEEGKVERPRMLTSKLAWPSALAAGRASQPIRARAPSHGASSRCARRGPSVVPAFAPSASRPLRRLPRRPPRPVKRWLGQSARTSGQLTEDRRTFRALHSVPGVYVHLVAVTDAFTGPGLPSTYHHAPIGFCACPRWPASSRIIVCGTETP